MQDGIEVNLVKDQYRNAFKTHGRDNAALLTPKGRHALRYRHMLNGIELEGKRVLDFGCGLGNLLRFFQAEKIDCHYTGVDFMHDFIDDSRETFDEGEFLKIDSIDDIEAMSRKFDIVLSCGVFNIMYSKDAATNRKYVEDSMKRLWALADDAFVIDFPSSHVDFKVDDAFHVPPEEMLAFAQQSLSRYSRIDHAYLPYEFCLSVFRDVNVISGPDLT